MKTTIFSERNGFNQQIEPKIIIHNDAPSELRGIVVELALNYGMKIETLRSLICRLLMKRKDESNWSYINIYTEVMWNMDNAHWYEIYDIIEEINAKINNNEFEQQINKYFIKNGIGWQLVNGKIETRAPEASEQIIRQSLSLLDNNGYQTTTNELHEAIGDLSRRPGSDNTGAIQHAIAALECFLRNVCNSKDTLGTILQKHKDIIPSPLPTAIGKLWGYASESGRHLQEGQTPTYAEAQLVVGICATIITYLITKNINHVANIVKGADDNMPF